VRSAPAHAGSLKPWERLVFALAFALMAAFVVVITVSAIRAREHSPRPVGPAASSGSSAGGAGRSPGDAGRSPGDAGRSPGDAGRSPGGAGRSPGGAPGGTRPQPSAAALDRQLADALGPVLLHSTGHLAVGIIDRTTGVRAIFNGGRQFHAAGVIKADILAALLLQHQQAGTVFSEDELRLAGLMIEYRDDRAANALWAGAGEASGMAAADAGLGLRHTRPGQGSSWAMTTTTVPDQLRLLTDLTSRRSPLTAASRSYELSLLRQVPAGQAWGVPPAATAGTSPAAANGWLPDPRLWVVNSIGVIRRAGQELLVAVLSDGQPTKSAGIAVDEAAAMAAVTQITGR
jgi:hypothetical protein